jgi:hypothetical protein
MADLKIVPLAELNGEGNGWDQVPPDRAEVFVVEDDAGNQIEGFVELAAAERFITAETA